MYYNDMYRGCYNPSTITMHKSLLDLLEEAMKDEKYDRAKYKMMMNAAKNEKIRKQIEFAYEDEGKHYRMFQQIYFRISGKTAEIPEPNVKSYDRFIDAVEDSINDELEAVELYRKIRALLPTRQLRDAVYEIITDEQEHAARLIYIYSMIK